VLQRQSVPAGRVVGVFDQSGARVARTTGYGQADDVLMARQSGFDLHLTKPAAADLLLERVAALMAGPALE